jgi:putative flippase GtrA
MTEFPSVSGTRLQTKLIRFGVVGLGNTALDLAIFTLAVGWDVPPLLANTLSWLGAVSFSYAVNSRWTFDRNQSLGEMTSAVRYLWLNALATLFLSSGMILLLGNVIGAMLAKLSAAAISVFLSFVVARWSIENRLF